MRERGTFLRELTGCGSHDHDPIRDTIFAGVYRLSDVDPVKSWIRPEDREGMEVRREEKKEQQLLAISAGCAWFSVSVLACSHGFMAVTWRAVCTKIRALL